MEKWQVWKSQAGTRGGRKSSAEGGGRVLHFSCTRGTGNKMYYQVPHRQLQVWKVDFSFVSLYPFLDVVCLFREVGGDGEGSLSPYGRLGVAGGWVLHSCLKGSRTSSPYLQPLALGPTPTVWRCCLTSTCSLCSESLR